MANSSVFQSKLKRLVFQPETTVGTAATIDGSSYLVPAEGVNLNPGGRGTKIIDRSGVNDGYAGGARGAPGSFASTLSFKTELFDVPSATTDSYWTLLLAACGHARLNQTGGVYHIQPAATAITGYTANTESPISLTMAVAQDMGAGSDDYKISTHGAVGAMTLELTAGERAMLSCEFKGMVVQPFRTIVASALTLGTFPVSSATPYVVKGLTATMINADDSQALDVVALDSLVLSSGADVPDVPDPTKSEGFGVSPVLFNSSPTVSFTIGSTALNNEYFWGNFADGMLIEIRVTLTGAAGRTIEVVMPKVQFTELVLSETNGYSSFEVEANCVRDLNSALPPYQIIQTTNAS